MEQFWAWYKVDGCDGTGDPIRGEERCAYFEKEFLFELVNIMWGKHQSIFQYHFSYIHNEILKPFGISILQYAQRILEMHYLAKYIHPPLMKGCEYNKAYWSIYDK